jgi:hypothetical protein
MELPVLKRHFGVVITHLYQVEGEESHIGITTVGYRRELLKAEDYALFRKWKSSPNYPFLAQEEGANERKVLSEEDLRVTCAIKTIMRTKKDLLFNLKDGHKTTQGTIYLEPPAHIKEISLSVQIILQHLELEPDPPIEENGKRNLYCVLQ